MCHILYCLVLWDILLYVPYTVLWDILLYVPYTVLSSTVGYIIICAIYCGMIYVHCLVYTVGYIWTGIQEINAVSY